MIAFPSFTIIGRSINTGYFARTETHSAFVIFFPSNFSLYNGSFFLTKSSAFMPSIRRISLICFCVGVSTRYSKSSISSLLFSLISESAVRQVEHVGLNQTCIISMFAGFHQVRLDKLIEVAVKHTLRVGSFNSCPQIFH